MGLLDDFVGGVADFFGLGGGGGGAATSYGVVSTIQGGDKPVALSSAVQGGDKPIGLVSTLQGGNKAVVVDVGLGDVNVDVGGTETPLHSILQVEVPKPITTNSNLAVTQPIVSEITSNLDVEPVQVDLCVDVGLTKLPKAHIHQPYDSHFGVTVFGAEVVGFNWTGQSNVVIDELPHRPHVELGEGRAHGAATPHRSPKRKAALRRSERGGLSIRLD